MLVFHKENLVFLAVPKTGTTAYHSALRDRADIVISDPPELKHAPVYRYNRFFRPMFEKVCGQDMETMAVMRDPIDWLGSWYRYRRRSFMKGKANSTLDITFDEFVNAYCKGDRPGFANVGSQAKFLEPRPNGTKVTHLFRYENRRRLDEFLHERLGLEIATRQENVSPEMALELDAKTERKMRNKCSEEFDLYSSIA